MRGDARGCEGMRGGCDGEALGKLFEKSFPNPSKASRRQEKDADGLGFKTVE